jgi:hypothetical protein
MVTMSQPQSPGFSVITDPAQVDPDLTVGTPDPAASLPAECPPVHPDHLSDTGVAVGAGDDAPVSSGEDDGAGMVVIGEDDLPEPIVVESEEA